MYAGSSARTGNFKVPEIGTVIIYTPMSLPESSWEDLDGDRSHSHIPMPPCHSKESTKEEHYHLDFQS